MASSAEEYASQIHSKPAPAGPGTRSVDVLAEDSVEPLSACIARTYGHRMGDLADVDTLVALLVGDVVPDRHVVAEGLSESVAHEGGLVDGGDEVAQLFRYVLALLLVAVRAEGE